MKRSSNWNSRVPSFLGYSNLLAGYLNLILPFAVGCWLLPSPKWNRLGKLTAVLGTVSLVLTRSRSSAGLVAFTCVLLIAIVQFVKNRKRQLISLAALLAGWPTAISVAGKGLSPEHLGWIPAREPMERLLFWATAWKMFGPAPVFWDRNGELR